MGATATASATPSRPAAAVKALDFFCGAGGLTRGLLDAAGYSVVNVDASVVAEAPKLGPHRDAMRTRLAEALGVEVAAISVKFTTNETMGFVGRAEGMAAMAVASLESA